MELISSFNNTVAIIAINNKNETLCVLEIVPPQWPDLFNSRQLVSSENMQYQEHSRIAQLKLDKEIHKPVQYLVLTPNIPHREANVLVFYRLHVKA
jgi:hypothetical protein